MRKAIFVLGCESSGTRMMTQFFIRAGYEGDNGHSQPWDNLEFRKYPDNIVFRQSIPHGGKWVDIVGITQKMQAANYTPYIILTWRDPRYTALSQVKAGHVTDKNEALTRIARAIVHIDTALEDIAIRPITIIYERFVVDHAYQMAIHGLFSAKNYVPMSFNNANIKYSATDIRSLNQDKLDDIADKAKRAKSFGV